ncbi:MAG: hypothetical protein GY711_12750 [bacterium]|nr:hypothetical protein [bacterium]
MTRNNEQFGKRAMCVALMLAFSASTASAQLVDLTLSVPECVVVGDIVTIDLNASSDGPPERDIAAIDAILSWDPALLELLGNDDFGAGYAWYFSGFLPDPDGINDTFVDGDGLYTALAQTAQAAQVPLAPGLRVTSFRFRARTSFASTSVSFVPVRGTFGATRVFDFYIPVNEITGDISSTSTVGTCRVLGSSYCSNTPNSTGVPGRIEAAGSDVASDNVFSLAARDLPPGRFGYFLASDGPGLLDLPALGLSDGFFCLAGGARLGRFDGQVQSSGPAGFFSISVDLTAVPIAVDPYTLALEAGDTWYFQCWYRDVDDRNNFTDAVFVDFL